MDLTKSHKHHPEATETSVSDRTMIYNDVTHEYAVKAPVMGPEMNFSSLVATSTIAAAGSPQFAKAPAIHHPESMPSSELERVGIQVDRENWTNPRNASKVANASVLRRREWRASAD